MKRIIFFIIALLLLSCTQVTEVTEKYFQSGEMKLIQVYPNNETLSRAPVTGKHNKDVDFENGIAYDENSFPVDNIIHTLDLSGLLNSKPGEIFLYCEWLDGAKNEQFQVFFKPFGLDVDYETTYVGYTAKKKLMNLVTDENGCIEWYHNYALPFDGRLPTSDPDYYDWNAISFRIMVYYYDNTGSINN